MLTDGQTDRQTKKHVFSLLYRCTCCGYHFVVSLKSIMWTAKDSFTASLPITPDYVYKL